MSDLFMKRVFISSPLRAETAQGIESNIKRAHRLCLMAMKLEGVAAYAPHGFYTAFLDDTDSDDRELGKQAGLTWLETADELWVWTRGGVSGGMKEEIEMAEQMGIPVVKDPVAFEGVDA